MKEIRYNDRLWFGKYNGTRLCEILKNDRNYAHKLISEHGFKLDQRSMDIIDGKSKNTFDPFANLEPISNKIHKKQLVSEPYAEELLDELDRENNNNKKKSPKTPDQPIIDYSDVIKPKRAAISRDLPNDYYVTANQVSQKTSMSSMWGMADPTSHQLKYGVSINRDNLNLEKHIHYSIYELFNLAKWLPVEFINTIINRVFMDFKNNYNINHSNVYLIDDHRNVSVTIDYFDNQYNIIKTEKYKNNRDI